MRDKIPNAEAVRRQTPKRNQGCRFRGAPRTGSFLHPVKTETRKGAAPFRTASPSKRLQTTLPPTVIYGTAGFSVQGCVSTPCGPSFAPLTLTYVRGSPPSTPRTYVRVSGEPRVGWGNCKHASTRGRRASAQSPHRAPVHEHANERASPPPPAHTRNCMILTSHTPSLIGV